ncbi:DAK2 domain-containing protein [Allostreptomyces psammosilenae]|uniref:DhaL domain-containing protein n=1 Tax=Allostreptomyces psammosilenae TaxID=1892865 RepID=A0A853A7S4_9ACTN|nr:DAK2 domain-containing protein [Allostreptomyces psammosilenae]NYI06588.1 hypothetical protein [Allostreptomyces psammosilenae]
MLDRLDAAAVRAWCRRSLHSLASVRDEIDALNVYPVPDGDTGTNLYLTLQSAAAAVERCFERADGDPEDARPGPRKTGGAAAPGRAAATDRRRGARDRAGAPPAVGRGDTAPADGTGGGDVPGAPHAAGAPDAPGASGGPSVEEALRAMADGALIGARGNSGAILAQLLRGMADSVGGPDPEATGAPRPTASAGPDEPARPGPSRAATGHRGRRPGGRAGYGRRGPGGRTTPAPHEPAASSARLGRDTAGAATGGVAAGAEQPDWDAVQLRRALTRAVQAGYEAVTQPVEGTVLSVARAAAEAADRAAGNLVAVARAAVAAARDALDRTPHQLDTLRRAGVVDAGGRGLVAVLDALAAVIEGRPATEGPTPEALADPRPVSRPGGVPAPGELAAPADTGRGELPGRPAVPGDPGGPGFEVMYLLDAPREAVPGLRATLDSLGDSLVVVGGPRLWNVHVHTPDAGAAVEAGIAAGRPHRIRITLLTPAPQGRPSADPCCSPNDQATPAGAATSDAFEAAPAAAAVPPADPVAGAPAADVEEAAAAAPSRTVIALASGDGLIALLRDHGAHVLPVQPTEPAAAERLAAEARSAGGAEVLWLCERPEQEEAALRAAELLTAEGRRSAVVPCGSSVHLLAALAVHAPERDYADDLGAMTAATAATRHVEVPAGGEDSGSPLARGRRRRRAAGRGAGAGKGGRAAGVGDVEEGAVRALEALLVDGPAGGEGGAVPELVTLVVGATAPAGLVERLTEQVQALAPQAEVVSYDSGAADPVLTIGVE